MSLKRVINEKADILRIFIFTKKYYKYNNVNIIKLIYDR